MSKVGNFNRDFLDTFPVEGWYDAYNSSAAELTPTTATNIVKFRRNGYSEETYDGQTVRVY